VERQGPATYRDLVDAPADKIAELVDGELYLSRRLPPRPNHARTALGGILGSAFDRPGDWVMLFLPQIHLGDDVVVPDLAGWRRERVPKLPNDYFDYAPDWACEVVTPESRSFDICVKRGVYGPSGVAHLWLVDADARLLEAFALRAGAWTLVAALKDDAEVRLPPFDAVGFPLSALWTE